MLGWLLPSSIIMTRLGCQSVSKQSEFISECAHCMLPGNSCYSQEIDHEASSEEQAQFTFFGNGPSSVARRGAKQYSRQNNAPPHSGQCGQGAGNVLWFSEHLHVAITDQNSSYHEWKRLLTLCIAATVPSHSYAAKLPIPGGTTKWATKCAIAA